MSLAEESVEVVSAADVSTVWSIIGAGGVIGEVVVASPEVESFEEEVSAGVDVATSGVVVDVSGGGTGSVEVASVVVASPEF